MISPGTTVNIEGRVLGTPFLSVLRWLGKGFSVLKQFPFQQRRDGHWLLLQCYLQPGVRIKEARLRLVLWPVRDHNSNPCYGYSAYGSTFSTACQGSQPLLGLCTLR